MDMIEITSQKRNELLQRVEVIALKDSEKAPSTEEIKNEIAQELKKEAPLVVVKKIKRRFGSKQFSVEVNVYDTEEAKNKVEPKKKEKKQAQPSEGK
jgi:ribosomal protein S24E